MSEGRHIVIVGMGPSATERKWDLARYIPAGAEVWGLNNGYLNYGHCLPLFTRWFELHKWDYLKAWDSHAERIGHADHFAALNAIGCDVYATEPLPRVVRQIAVDWVKVFGAHVGRGAANYFLGSPSLMLAIAIYEHDNGQTVSQIDSWGIDTSDPTHAQQRQSWAYWISQAHARGIETGGTANAFMAEPEQDAGLQGLRERTGDIIQANTQAPGTTDYVVASFATDNEPFRSHARRLEGECKALGVPCMVRMLPAAKSHAEGIRVVRHAMTDTIRMAWEKFNKTVVFLDADETILKLPTIPEGFDGAGLIENPERQHYGDRALPASYISAWACTDAGRAALDVVAGVEKAISYHRGVNALWTAGRTWGGLKVRDITAHFRGCIQINPNRGRTTVCRT
jgi:hypothetical protein